MFKNWEPEIFDLLTFILYIGNCIAFFTQNNHTFYIYVHCTENLAKILTLTMNVGSPLGARTFSLNFPTTFPGGL